METNEEKKLCACGCGEEVTTWKNGRTGPFRRGHHMRVKGYDFYKDCKEPRYCKCGCGTLIKPLANGFLATYIKGHHLKGSRLSLEYRIERTEKRWGRKVIFSPYLEDVFLHLDNRSGSQRWYACLRTDKGKVRRIAHARAVYEHHFGEIPEGMVVHHKSGRATEIEDDHPDNLMLLPDEWNLRFFPVLAKGFGIEEKIVTNAYLTIDREGLSDADIFSELCRRLTINHAELSK